MKTLTAKSRAIDVPRLATAMEHSRRSLERFRSNRREAVREYVGNRWSEEGPGRPVYVNLIELFARTIGRNLIAKSPRVMLSTWDRGSKPVVRAMQDWVNKEVERQKIETQLSRVVFDALFSVGILKVALARPADSAGARWNLRAGEPFLERVDLDDFAFDPHCRDFREASFIAHRSRVPLESVRESSLYSKGRKDLTPSTARTYNQEGDERINVLGRGYQGYTEEEYEDMVDLWEVYLPGDRLVVTLAADEGGVPYEDWEPLLVQEWVGPDCGPYHFLGFGVVPGNAMPLAPVQNLYDLHLAINEIYRKLIRQALRQKDLTFVMGGATEDGKRVMDANDGEILRVDNPEKIAQVTMGGPNQGNFLLGEHLKQVFDMLGGNLSIVGGLAPQSKTASQDKMLNENSGRSVSDMQDTTVRFVASGLGAMCWYWHHHPVKEMRTKYSPAGAPEFSVEEEPITPRRRAGIRWEDLDLRVDPYSLQHQTPQSRIAALNQVVTQVVVPLMGLLQQQGISFDLHAYLDKMGEYMDLPDLAEIVTIAEPPQQQGGGGTGGNASTPNQPREYIRRSLGGDSAGAQQNQLETTLARGMGQGQSQGPMSPGGAR